ncbi:MAG: C45 family peptidase [Acidimicrobiia bacterium]
MFGGNLRVLEIFGDSADLGRGHGESCAQMIRKYLDDRMGLSAQERWSGGDVDRDLILELSEQTLEFHEAFSPALYTEMLAMSEAAGITPAEALVVGGFTDIVDLVRSEVGTAPEEHNCTAVINPEAGFYAQTWDMHASAGEFVIMLKLDPLMGPDALVQTTAGCLGQMGMNEAGISVGINNLSSMGKPGVTWPFVVRKALAQTTLEDATDVVVGANVAGGHNFMIMGPDGRGVNVEAMPNHKTVTLVEDAPYVHANHCVDPMTASEHGYREPEHVENSELRLEIGRANAATPEAFFKDPEISRWADQPHDIATCGAIVVEPAQRKMRVVWGLPGEHPWESFQL